MTERKIPLLCITGPTASGKSALAVRLAQLLGGEVVSCDSMQIYRGMDIGTAKPTEAEMCGVPHHMIDIVAPSEDYSCGRYAYEAAKVIKDIASRGALPIVCGGTGLYLDSLITATEHADAPSDPAMREELLARDAQSLHDELSEIDAESAAAIHPNNKRRVARAIEIYRITGRTKSEWDRRSHDTPSPYDASVVALGYLDRELLYRRIRMRVDEMFDRGLCDEVCSLDLDPDSTAAAAIGYKEVGTYLRGECTEEQAREAVKLATTRYAKRQLSWLRGRSYVKWAMICGDPEQDKKMLDKIVNISLILSERL